MQAGFKRVKGNIPSTSNLRAELLDYGQKGALEVGNKHVNMHERVVAQWKSPPRFVSYTSRVGDHIFMQVRITGSQHDVDKWHWMNDGQPERTIYAKSSGGMVFQEGYSPSTRYRRIGSSRAKRYGKVRRARQVRHSQEAREIGPEVLRRRFDPDQRIIFRYLWNGFRRGLR